MTTITSSELRVPTLDGGAMQAYAAWPEGATGRPVAVVFGELFGLNDVQRGVADRIAAMGFVAIAPDLLHRRAPGGPIEETDAGRAQALAVAGALTRLEVVSDAEDALAAARSLPAADPVAAGVAVGVSFGGHAAILSAALLGLPKVAALYAGWLAGTEIAVSQPEPTAELAAARLAASGGRALLLVGDGDPLVPLADAAFTEAAFAAAGAALELHAYPGVGHRFVAEGRPGYDAAAAADAWRRVASFLA